MYLRKEHVEKSIPALRKFVEQNPLGILTTAISTPNAPFLQCSHIPWVIDIIDEQNETELPRLKGHIARQNPQAQSMIEEARSDGTDYALPHALKTEVMILFNGPAHHYVTPKFYTQTKPESGKVVPTWNYSAVQVYGTATVYVDHQSAHTQDFLHKQIRALSHAAETRIMGYERPWSVEDAPESYIGLLAKNIIGIEVDVTSLGGKFKMSQEMPKGDVDGVAEGFEKLGTEEGMNIAQTVRQRNGY